MQLKYALLHCSYSAPTRVLDILSATVSNAAARGVATVAARDTRKDAGCCGVRCTVVVALRDIIVSARAFADGCTDVRDVVVREVSWGDVLLAVLDTVGAAVRTTALRPATARVVAVREIVF